MTYSRFALMILASAVIMFGLMYLNTYAFKHVFFSESRKALGSTPAWHLSAAEIEANASRIHALINGKTLSADTAVQVALINNRALQANFTDLGLSSAELWEAAMYALES